MADPILVLAWLVFAHLAADFLFQTASIVRAKNGRGRAAAGGLLAHGAIVAGCLVPVGLAYGGPGWAFLASSAVLHIVIDETKIVLSRRAAAHALAGAARPERPQPPDHLGRAWTAAPAGLFLLDQVAHLAVAVVAWAAFLVPAGSLLSGWTTAVDFALGTLDRAAIHDVIGVVVVLASLAIVNIRAGSIFVSILVRPVEESEGETRWGDRAGRVTEDTPAVARGAAEDAAEPARRWSIRIGPLEGRVESQPERPSTSPAASTSDRAAPVATSARVGAAIGILERVLIVVFVLTGTDVAIGFVVAAKTLARFRLLDDREFAEYYLLGTLGSVAVAIVSALIGRAALGALLA